MYLLDTNVVSELLKSRPHGAVLEWIEEVEDDSLFVSAVTLGEIQAGIELTRDQDPMKAEELSIWADRLSETFNVLPVDAHIFRLWARLMHRRSDELLEDALIAATARVHGLTVATRNIRDFAAFAVPTFNPFKPIGRR